MGRMEIAEFLLARIAEDEAECQREIADGYGGWQHESGWPSYRVLAECEAKRRIVEQYADYLSTVKAYRSPRWADAMNEQDKENARQAEARHRVAEDVAKLLALPYSDHPDYDEAWKA